jgi:hypothetical protein
MQIIANLFRKSARLLSALFWALLSTISSEYTLISISQRIPHAYYIHITKDMQKRVVQSLSVFLHMLYSRKQFRAALSLTPVSMKSDYIAIAFRWNSASTIISRAILRLAAVERNATAAVQNIMLLLVALIIRCHVRTIMQSIKHGREQNVIHFRHIWRRFRLSNLKWTHSLVIYETLKKRSLASTRMNLKSLLNDVCRNEQ